MTAFITRCCRRLAEAIVVLALSLAPALAGEIGMSGIRLAPAEDGAFVLSADFDIEFGQRLEEAVGKGLALHFVAEFELTRPRWYWLDERVLSAQRPVRLSYNALTSQYRVVVGGGLHQSFATLGEGLQMLSRLRNWQVVDKAQVTGGSLRPGETYLAALRLRLDISQLPRPFQISALGNRDWNLASDWRLWQLNLPPAPAAWSDGR